MHPGEIWQGRTAKAATLRALLTPLSWLYAAGWQTYLEIYRLGLKRPLEVHRPVIVVGNLAVGGSGKTPVTLEIARTLIAKGRVVVVGCSGYGGPHAEGATIAPEGPLAASEWGDEPAMLRWLEPDLHLVVGRARVQAARLVHDRYPNSVLVMDDGFQHLPLMKHISIVLDERAPYNRMCIPAGPYREPRKNLSRADTIVWTGSDGPGFQLRRSSIRLVTPEGIASVPESGTALCAIGRPDAFLVAVSAVTRLSGSIVLPDHDNLASGTLFDRLPEGEPIIVTAKDWVKLRGRSDLPKAIYIALEEVAIEPNMDFQVWLSRKLDEFKT